MNHRRERTGWSSGGSATVPPSAPTAFELRVSELSLSEPAYYSESPELRQWCQVNRNKCYIPEWLLKEWDITVNSDI